MHHLPDHLPDRTRCLALQKLNARNIKNAFISEGSIQHQQHVAHQVIRYSTLLSEKMLDKIKTQELRQFQKNVQQYCRESHKLNQAQKPQSFVCSTNVSQHLQLYKDSTKAKLLQQNQKKRTKTSQSISMSITPKKMITSTLEDQSKLEIPLGNKRIKQMMESNKRRGIPANKFQLKGKGFNSQICNLLDKLDEMELNEKLKRKKNCVNQEEEESLFGRTYMLKKENQRLNTAAEGHERAHFRPIGRVKKNLKHSYDRNQMRQQLTDPLAKLTSKANQAIMLRPLRKSQIVISSNFIANASLQLHQGLPTTMNNRANNKIAKRKQRLIDMMEGEREGAANQKDNNQNLTPKFQSKEMFLSTQVE